MSTISEQEAREAIGRIVYYCDGVGMPSQARGYDPGMDMTTAAEWARQELFRRESERKLTLNGVRQTNPTNCFAACVATILRVPIEQIPGVDGANWDWDRFQEWLASRGLQAIEIGFGNGGTLYPVKTPVPCIVTGESPRECKTGRHAVVGELLGLEGFRLLHDPHPSEMWINGEPTHATFFVETSSNIARREAEQAERSKPITAEWLRSIGWVEKNGTIGVYRWEHADMLIDWDGEYGVSLLKGYSDWVELESIATRGKLLDLLAALKGGE